MLMLAFVVAPENAGCGSYLSIRFSLPHAAFVQIPSSKPLHRRTKNNESTQKNKSNGHMTTKMLKMMPT